jgi:hypothetical protein
MTTDRNYLSLTVFSEMQDRPAVYRRLLSLVAEDDFGVSLAGVAALQDLVQDWDFQEEPFMEFVAPCFQLLALRLQEANELETQMQASFLSAPDEN